MPMVVGVFRPIILISLAFGTGMTPEQVRMVFYHELAHIQRFDPVVNLFQRTMEAAFFYHPAVWFVSRQIRFERELCCDDVVVRVHGAPRAYAESLVELAVENGARGIGAAALGAADAHSDLGRRVMRLIGAKTNETMGMPQTSLLAVALIAGLLLLGGTVYSQTAAQDDEPSDAAKSEQELEGPGDAGDESEPVSDSLEAVIEAIREDIEALSEESGDEALAGKLEQLKIVDRLREVAEEARERAGKARGNAEEVREVLVQKEMAALLEALRLMDEKVAAQKAKEANAKYLERMLRPEDKQLPAKSESAREALRKLKVEYEGAQALHKRGIISDDGLKEVKKALGEEAKRIITENGMFDDVLSSTREALENLNFEAVKESIAAAQRMLEALDFEHLLGGIHTEIDEKMLEVDERGKAVFKILDFVQPVSRMPDVNQPIDLGGRSSSADVPNYTLYNKHLSAEEDPLRKIVDLNFHEMRLTDIIDVLRDLGEINIVTDVPMDGIVTANLQQIPLGQGIEAIFRMQGLGIIEKNGIYRIVTWEEAVKSRRETRMIVLEKAVAEEIALLLSQVMTGTADGEVIKIVANKTRNVVILSGPSELVQEYADLIKKLDTAKPIISTVTEPIQLKYAEPADLIPAVTNLLSEIGTVAFDSRSRQLIATDLPVKVEEIRALVEKLDVPIEEVSIDGAESVGDLNLRRKILIEILIEKTKALKETIDAAERRKEVEEQQNGSDDVGMLKSKLEAIERAMQDYLVRQILLEGGSLS